MFADLVKINNVDITNFGMEENGIEIAYRKVIGNNSNLMLDGSFYDDFLYNGFKRTITLLFSPLEDIYARKILRQLVTPTFSITIPDPYERQWTGDCRLQSNITTQLRGVNLNEQEVWYISPITVEEV